jgi:hypothetical protein
MLADGERGGGGVEESSIGATNEMWTSSEIVHSTTNTVLFLKLHLKGHVNETDFLGLLQKLVPHVSLTLPFRPFRFWLWIRIRKTTPAITYTGSHRLSVTVIRGVADSAYQWCGESSTPRLNDTGSHRLPVSPIRRVGYWIFLKENSRYRWYGESSTPRTSDTVSRRLPVSLSGESPTPRIVESGSRRLRISVIRGVPTRKKN